MQNQMNSQIIDQMTSNKYSLRQKNNLARQKIKAYQDHYQIQNSCHPSLTRISNFDSINCFLGGSNVQKSPFYGIKYLKNKHTISTTSSSSNIQKTTNLSHKHSLKHNRQANSHANNNSLQQHNHRTRHHTDTYSVSLNDDLLSENSFQKYHFQKLSLRNNNPIKHKKSQLLICLDYPDLHNKNKNNNSNTIFKGISDKIQGLLCNSRLRVGCPCQPKCKYIHKWLSYNSFVDFSIPRVINKNLQSIIVQIQKDISRTQPHHKAFQSQILKQDLQNILIRYAKLDPDVGYVQGMNFIVSVLVYHSSNADQAFKVLVYLMFDKKLRCIFLSDLSTSRTIASILVNQLRKSSFDLYTHLISQGIQLQLFVSSWYFSLCGSFIPLDSMHLIIDKFLKNSFTGLNEIILTLLIKLKYKLKTEYDSKLMSLLSNQKISQISTSIDWEDLVNRSDQLHLKQILL